MNNQELAKIVKRVKGNKKKHFEDLFNEIYRTVYYLSLKFLDDNEAEAQDVSQDILVYIYNHIEELKLPEGFNNWMNRIIYNQCKNRARTLSRRREDYKEEKGRKEEQIFEDNPEKVIQTKERKNFVLELIDDLPMKQKEVILLYYYQQLTTPEIAEILSCSLPSIQNRLHNAKKSIRERVNKSKEYTPEQLFTIGGVPLLWMFISQEAQTIATGTIKGRLWTKSRNKIPKYKTNKYMLCLIPVLTILIFSIIMLMTSLLKRATEAEKPRIESQHQSEEMIMETQPTVIVQNREEQNKLPNRNGIEKAIETDKNTENEEMKEVQNESEEETNNITAYTKEEVQTNLRVEVPEIITTSNEWMLYPVEREYQVVVWGNRIEQKYTNTAVLEDEGLEELKFTTDAGTKIKGEVVYDEERYKKDSDTVYHAVYEPTLSFEKTSFWEKDIITYHIHVENIGEIAAYNIIIKDKVPKNTKLVQVQKEVTDNPVKVSNIYRENQETIFWILDRLEPAETVTLVFQVRVEEKEYGNYHEIKNIAYMKVTGKGSDVSNLLEEEQDYIESNEIIYAIQQQEKPIPKTSDGTGDIRRLTIITILSVVLMIYTLNQIQNKNKNKEDTVKSGGR